MSGCNSLEMEKPYKHVLGHSLVLARSGIMAEAAHSRVAGGKGGRKEKGITE
jgi:hypothetical protein